MIRTDEDALICDLAETYRIYNYRQLPATTVAVFSFGLRDNSRIKQVMSGQTVPTDTLLLASVSDRLGTLLWINTTDGQKGINRPKSFLDLLIPDSPKKPKDTLVFESGEDFTKQRNELLARMRGDVDGN